MLNTREALEAALVRTPNDLTLHMAYADCLIEEGDPRGEWIRLCLEKERPELSLDEKRITSNAIRRIRNANDRHWMGAFDNYLTCDSFDSTNTKPELLIRWRRGWIHHFQATPYDLPLIDEVMRHPFLKLVREFILYHSEWDRISRPRVVDFSFLRTLGIPGMRSFHLSDRNFDDDALPHLLEAPYFAKLRSLSLSWTNLTDFGAAKLLEHPHVAKLKHLSLEGTAVTEMGCEMFLRIGKRITNHHRHQVDPPDEWFAPRTIFA